MIILQATKLWQEYHGLHSKKNTNKTYNQTFTKFKQQYGSKDIKDLSSDDILTFLNQNTKGKKQSTKRTRFSHLNAFFNFIKENTDLDFVNPCDNPMLKKIYKGASIAVWDIIDKEIVDETIFRTTKKRDRLILELMARGGMRIGEVLNLKPPDVNERKLIIRDPKSGREHEAAFIPQKIAGRLKSYIDGKKIEPDQRIFQICYEAARIIVKKAGEKAGIRLRPHDLRRHAATYASRSGVPIEIVSRIILRHSNLSTTQRYLGKISDVEAMKWIENLYG